MVDATIVTAPSSTKNKKKQRDQEMKSTRKNNQFYFGMKIHIASDINTNTIHSATVTSANIADISELSKLLRPDDKVVFADAGYTSDAKKRDARRRGVTWKVNDKRKPKCQFGYKKTRYKGLQKNKVQVFALLGLANLYMHREKLMG